MGIGGVASVSGSRGTKAAKRELEAAGVDTIPELAQRNAENLHAKLVEVNGEQNIVQKLPSAETVADWVAQAKELPRVITH